MKDLIGTLAIDRRQMVIGATSVALTSLFASPLALAAAREQTLIINSTAIPVEPGSKPWKFDLFFDLSRYITARSELDMKTAQLLFEQFRREEWGWANAARLYSKLRDALSMGAASVPDFLIDGQLSDLDQWFAQHILDAWYEGFYRYEGTEIRVTYEKALMWEAVRDVVPVQGLSDAEYGYWSKRPQNGDLE